MKNDNIKGAIVVFIMAFAFAGTGIFLIFNNIRMFSTYAQTSAVVTNVYSKTVSDDDGTRTKYSAAFEYEVDGVKYNAVGEYSEKHYREGNEITVYYNAENPSEACTSKSNFTGAVFIFMGVMFATCGVLTLKQGKY